MKIHSISFGFHCVSVWCENWADQSATVIMPNGMKAGTVEKYGIPRNALFEALCALVKDKWGHPIRAERAVEILETGTITEHEMQVSAGSTPYAGVCI